MKGKVQKIKPQQLWKSRSEYQGFPLQNGQTVLASLIIKLDMSNPSTPMCIPWFAVRDRYRSCGIGGLLVQIARQIQRQEIGRVEIFLVADHLTEKAQLFYQHEGFAKVNWGSDKKDRSAGTQ